MPLFSAKTEQEDLCTAIRHVHSATTDDNCVDINLPGSPELQFLYGTPSVHNVAPVPNSQLRSELKAQVQLPVHDEGRRFVVFESNGESADEAIGEIEHLLVALDMGRRNIDSVRTFETFEGDETILQMVKDVLGVAG